MGSADSGSDGNDDRVAIELTRLREVLDEVRHRPTPIDADTLRHVITASLSEASAPPPNLLVTAIRRLDRVDSRLESIESALTGKALPPAGGTARPRGPAPAAPAPPSPSGPALPAPMPVARVDAEAVAEIVARRLGSLPSAPPQRGGGPTVEDLVASLRPLIPGAARTVLRRGGREPSAQAVEVLQQAALAALEEAASSLGPITGHASQAPSPWVAQPAVPPAPVALPPPPAAPPPSPQARIDVDALAATIASRVTASVTASVAKQLAEPEVPAAPPAPPPPTEPRREAAPAVDPAAVADVVVARLAEQPPPQAVVSALAMVPLVAAVGNVEAAVAKLTVPNEDVVAAVARLEAGIEALARALEEDRSAQADELRRGFVEVTQLVREGQAAAAATASDAETGDPHDQEGDLGGVVGLHRRLDEIAHQLAPLATAVPALEGRGHRLERSISHILTALAALADHLSDQSSLWRAGLDSLAAAQGDAAPPRSQPAGLHPSDGAAADDEPLAPPAPDATKPPAEAAAPFGAGEVGDEPPEGTIHEAGDVEVGDQPPEGTIQEAGDRPPGSTIHQVDDRDEDRPTPPPESTIHQVEDVEEDRPAPLPEAGRPPVDAEGDEAQRFTAVVRSDGNDVTNITHVTDVSDDSNDLSDLGHGDIDDDDSHVTTEIDDGSDEVDDDDSGVNDEIDDGSDEVDDDDSGVNDDVTDEVDDDGHDAGAPLSAVEGDGMDGGSPSGAASRGRGSARRRRKARRRSKG